MLRVIAGVVGLCATVVSNCTSSFAETPAMKFAVQGGFGCAGFAPCVWIVADGAIAPDSAKHLRDLMYAKGLGGSQELSGIVINSPEGALIGAVSLGRLIREERLNAIVAKVVCDKE